MQEIDQNLLKSLKEKKQIKLIQIQLSLQISFLFPTIRF